MSAPLSFVPDKLKVLLTEFAIMLLTWMLKRLFAVLELFVAFGKFHESILKIFKIIIAP